MTRLSKWPELLNDYLASMEGVIFEWGVSDCCTFADGAVQAMTGEEAMAEFRGKYSTATGAARALVEHGAGTLEATLDTKFEERATGFARRGDLVLHDGCVGVVIGKDAFFVGEEGGQPGLVRVLRGEWTKAWTVG